MSRRRSSYLSLAYSHAPTDPRVRRHCEALATAGWKVVQLGIGLEGEPAVGHAAGVVMIRWHKPRYRGSALFRYAWAYVRFMLWARVMTARLSRRRRIDLVQVNNVPTFLIWASSPAKRRGARVVLDIHDPEPELFLSKFSSRPGAGLAARLLALGERLCARGADLVFCVHEHHRRLTERHGVPGSKLRVVVNHADGQVFPIGKPRQSGPVVGYHGTVSRRMGLDVVLQAVAGLRRDGLSIRGAIYGDGDDVPRLQVLRTQLGLDDSFVIPGQRFRIDDLLPRIREFGIGLVPLRRDPLTDIMLPTKLIEYVRLGIPAVVCWTPTVADHFPEETVYYVRDFSPKGLTAVVKEVLSDPAAARERAERAQRLPIARSWQDAGAPEYINMMRGLVESHHG